MVIVLNTNACGGKGFQKWNLIKNKFINSQTHVISLQEDGFEKKLSESIKNGETKFIASGGDGTVNLLLNYLIQFTTSEQLKEIVIGAIGIGSSNDFHKPFNSKNNPIPYCIDFQSGDFRDVGLITCETISGKVEKYFLINASVGITAEANNLFNKSNFILRRLKQFNTKSAILYSAIKTIVSYKNLMAEIFVNGNKLETPITNLGITKNPHFSGDFRYDSPVDYTSGKFDVHLAHDMNGFEVLNLMKALTYNCFSKLKKTRSWISDNIKITSINNFTVEYDGEVLVTNRAEFKVLHNFIKVCGNGESI